MDYIILDNLPESANMILNVLWDKNREMSLEELTQTVDEEFNRRWHKEDIQTFADYLVKADYILRKRHLFHPYYIAVGADFEL